MIEPHLSDRGVRAMMGAAFLGLFWLLSGCGTSTPPPPTESWVTTPRSDSSATPKALKKKSVREEDSALSGREKRALLREKKAG